MCDSCGEYDTACHADSDGQVITTAGLVWSKNAHQRGSGVPATMMVYPEGADTWEALECEELCACQCAQTPGCVSFDFRSADNRLCRMYNERSRASGGSLGTASVACEYNHHHWEVVPPPQIAIGRPFMSATNAAMAAAAVPATAASDWLAIVE